MNDTYYVVVKKDENEQFKYLTADASGHTAVAYGSARMTQAEAIKRWADRMNTHEILECTTVMKPFNVMGQLGRGGNPL